MPPVILRQPPKDYYKDLLIGFDKTPEPADKERVKREKALFLIECSSEDREKAIQLAKDGAKGKVKSLKSATNRFQVGLGSKQVDIKKAQHKGKDELHLQFSGAFKGDGVCETLVTDPKNVEEIASGLETNAKPEPKKPKQVMEYF